MIYIVPQEKNHFKRRDGMKKVVKKMKLGEESPKGQRRLLVESRPPEERIEAGGKLAEGARMENSTRLQRIVRVIKSPQVENPSL